MEEVGIKGWNSDIFVAVWIIATIMAILVLMVAWIDTMNGSMAETHSTPSRPAPVATVQSV